MLPGKQTWFSPLGIAENLPDEVRVCGDRLNSCGVWWRVVFNYERTEVLSCRHAVKFRERLGSGGNGGIPLWAELKSLAGVAIDLTLGKQIGFAAHTRANTRFNEGLLLHALGLCEANARIKLVFHDEEVNLSGDPSELVDIRDKVISAEKWFGKVNPFNIDYILRESTDQNPGLEHVHQILDESLELDGGVPNTIMSNLGDRITAFEIHPWDLIAAVKLLSPQSMVARVAEPCPVWLGTAGAHRRDYWLQFPPAQGPKIGILTGNSPESGMTLWHDILQSLRRIFSYLPDPLMPDVEIHSAPQMGLSMDLINRQDEVREVVRNGVNTLLDAGCSIVTFACNTTIYYEPEISVLCTERGARFVSIAEACIPAIRRALNGVTQGANVGLVGIGPVVDMSGPFSGYKRYLEAEGVNVKACPADRLAFAVKSKGTQAELVTEFRRLMTAMLPDETVVILALTEISMVYREHIATVSKNRKSNKIFIDPLLELGRYLAFLYLSVGYRACEVCQIPDGFDVDAKLRSRFGWI